MSGEFEDRENEALGELPTSVQTERREFSQADADKVPVQIPPDFAIGQQGSNASIPPDIQKQADALQKGQGQFGSPVIPASVISIYDARPINARDWMRTDWEGVIAANGQPANLDAELVYTIPEGFTGVWRGFRFKPAIIAAFNDGEKRAGLEFDAVRVTCFINNTVVPDYDGLKLGQVSDFRFDTFVLGNSGQEFKIQIVYSSDIADRMSNGATGSGSPTAILMEMYGNNLLTRGLPKAFEISSQNKTGSNL